MITILNPSEIEKETTIIRDLGKFGINHLTTEEDLGWNYILDQVWLTKEIEEYYPKIDKINPIILDIGCGNSIFHNFLEKRLNLNIWGIDRPMGYCHQEIVKNVDFLVDFLEFNYFDPGSVDIIYWLSSIEHNQIQQIKRLFNKSLELLRPGGLLLITFPLSLKTEWFIESQQTNLSSDDALAIFEEEKFEGSFIEICEQYKNNTLNLYDKYIKRYGKLGSNGPLFVVSGLSKHNIKEDINIINFDISNLYGPYLFFPHSDTHVQWMIPIADGLNPSKFVTFPSQKSENAEMRLQENGINYYEYSPSLIYQLKPRILVFGNDWSNPEVFQQAKEMSVPTVVIQEGVLDFVSPGSNRMLLADYAFIQGEIMNEYLIRPRIITTGNPKYDLLYELPFPENNVIMVNCNFTYGVFIDARKDWLDDVVKTINELQIKFFVSKHPRDPGGFTEGIEVVNSNAYLVKEQLSKCSIVVTRFSTLIYEAIVAGRQVIYYNPHGEDYSLLSSDKTGTIIYAKNRQELRGAIIEAINRKNKNSNLDRRNSFLLNHIGTINHDATIRCQNEIIKIVEQNKLTYKHLNNLYIDSLRRRFEDEKRLDNNIIKKRLWVKIINLIKKI
jgi:SAM-dependent methyltransferase